MSAVTHTTGLDIDQMVADAQKRLAAFVARAAAQQQRRMLEAWATPAQATATAPSAPQAADFGAAAPSWRFAAWPPDTPATTAATPWLDDITPTSPVVDDQDEDDDTELANFALCLMGGAALIFVTGFSLGYLLGG